MTLEIRKVLVLSTGHVSKDTAEWLDEATDTFNQDLGVSPIVGGRYGDVGWIVYAQAEDHLKNVPADLVALMKFARDNSAHHLLFDRDADKIDYLPYFEW